MGNTAAQFKLCPKVLSGCEHPSVVNADGAVIGCGDYRGPAVVAFGEFGERSTPCMLVENLNDCIDCDWCDGFVRAAFTVRYDGWMDRVCVMHGLQYFPELMPRDKRPAEYGSTFELREILTTVDGRSLLLDRRRYERSDDMFEASRRPVMRDGRMIAGWSLVSRSSNAHYRRTGHFRATYEHTSGVRVTVHAVVR